MQSSTPGYPLWSSSIVARLVGLRRSLVSIDGGHRSVGILLHMPRAARKAPGGQVYHVLNRSVGKMHLFGKDADFEAFQQVMIEAHQRHPIRILSYCVLSRRPGDGLLPLAGTHACDALEGRAADRRVRSSVSGTVPELPGAERRTSVDRLAVHRAECCGGRVGRAGGALAHEAACGRGCMEKMRSRPSYRLGRWNAPWIGPIA